MPILFNAWRLSRLQALRWSQAVRARKQGLSAAVPGSSQPLSSSPPLTPQSSNPSSTNSSKKPHRNHRLYQGDIDDGANGGQGRKSLDESRPAHFPMASHSEPELRAAAKRAADGGLPRGGRQRCLAASASYRSSGPQQQGTLAAHAALVPPCPILSSNEQDHSRVELEPLERFLLAYDAERLDSVAAALRQAGQKDDVGSCVNGLRKRFSALLPSEQAVLESHFLRDHTSAAGSTERFVAFDEALSFFSSLPPTTRTGLLRALQSLASDRFDGSLAPLLQVWRHSAWPSSVWRQCMIVAQQVCPQSWDIDTFVAMLDWLAGLDSVVWRRLQRVAVPIVEIVERRTGLDIEACHAERYVEVLAVAADLPPNLLDEVASLVDCIVDDEDFEGKIEVSLYTIATVLGRAKEANELTPAAWPSRPRVELMESLTELAPEQHKTLERLGSHLLDEVQSVIDGDIPSEASEEWGALLTNLTRLPVSEVLSGIRAVGADSAATLSATHGKQRMSEFCRATERMLERYEARKHYRLAYLPTLEEDS